MGKNQSLQLKQFWIRRFRRLIPAVYVMIVVVVIYAVFFHPEILKTYAAMQLLLSFM